MLVLVNHSASRNHAGVHAEKVIAELHKKLGEFDVFEYHQPTDITSVIDRELHSGSRQVISVGGDGTLNYVVNAIMKSPRFPAAPVQLGAVGLGSSNDALKPVLNRLQGLPACIDMTARSPIDIGCIAIVREDGRVAVRYFIANSGIGVIANANATFNQASFAVRILSKMSVTSAIQWVALQTVVGWKGAKVDVVLNGTLIPSVNIDAISIVKIPWIGGNYCYDQVTKRDSGLFGVHISKHNGLLGLLRLMRDLSSNAFSTRPGRTTTFSPNVVLCATMPFAVEYDGEVDHCVQASYSVVPKAIEWMAL